jgi:raffinose/stachyose/melibiose transport system substrate-binding protein
MGGDMDMKQSRGKVWPFVFALAFCMAVIMPMTACTGDGGKAASAGDGGEAASASDGGEAASAGDGGEATLEEDADISGTATISIISSNQPGMEAIIAEFEQEYPDCTIDAEFVADIQAYNTQIPVRLSGGNGPDLVFAICGSASSIGLTRFAEAGYLMDLSNQPWTSNMYEATKNMYSYDGKIVAKDFGMSALASIIYDKNYFEANGFQPPKTFDELISLCQDILKIGDRIPITWGGALATVNHNNLCAIAGNTVLRENPNWMQDRTDGKVTYKDTPGWRLALEQIKELNDLGAFGPAAASVPFAEMSANLGDGKAAMAFTYGGVGGMAMNANPELNVGMFAFPAEKEEDTRLVLQLGGSVGIYAQAKNPDVARAFLDFWSRPEMEALYAQKSTLISPAQARDATLTDTYAELAYIFAEDRTVSDPSTGYPNPGFSDSAGASVQGLFTGQKTIDQILDDLDMYYDTEN